MSDQDKSIPYVENASELEWINVRGDLSTAEQNAIETNQEKFNRKLRENPFVPIGCLVTAGVLCLGLRSFIKGDRKLSQKMMRFRVLAQGGTIVALLVPMLYAASVTNK